MSFVRGAFATIKNIPRVDSSSRAWFFTDDLTSTKLWGLSFVDVFSSFVRVSTILICVAIIRLVGDRLDETASRKTGMENISAVIGEDRWRVSRILRKFESRRSFRR